MKTIEEGQPFGGRRDALACWIPVGLIAAGAAGAVAGLAQVSRKRARRRRTPVPHSEELTPPHGDKLMARDRW